MGNNRKILHGVSIAILLIFVFLAIGSASTPDRSEDHDQAIEHYTERIRMNPNDAVAYNNRGRSYFRKGEYDKAIADYEAGLLLNPDEPYLTTLKQNLGEAQQAQARMSVRLTQNQQGSGQPSNSYFTGDGGRNIRLAVLAPAGTGLSRDEQWMLSHIQGAITGNIDKYSAITVQASTANASHVLASSLRKTQSGYTLELSVTDTASGEKVFAYPPTQISLAEIETLSGVKTASADLLGQMGVNITARGQQILAQAHSQDDFEIRQNTDNTLTITGYKGALKDVVIPGTLYGLKVTVIGETAFQDKNITSVVIPDTVITIENAVTRGRTGFYINGAFRDAKELSEVTLGSELKTIGSYAFAGTKITEIIIPDSVTSIGECAFRSSGLTKVTFGTGLQTITKEAFRGNQITELTLPSSVKVIEESAFQYSKIQKVTFGTSLQTIGPFAFRSNEIVELDLPSSLRNIGGGAFSENQIQSVIIPDGVVGIYVYNMTSTGGSIIGAFAQNPLTTVVIPASLTRFENRIFPRDSITRITIPTGMDERTLRGNFEEAFVNFWISQNRAGGTYIKNGPIWSKE